MRRAVFLDRDGVINANRADYVKSWDEVAILPGALTALARAEALGEAVVVEGYMDALTLAQSGLGQVCPASPEGFSTSASG